MRWPENKDFAFTVFDDTDNATLENVKPVYDMLSELGFRTTKSVWVSKGTAEPVWGGATCEDQDYAKWLVEIQQKGFEIAYHMNTYHSSIREEIIEGLKKFKDMFGHYPRSMANHTGCADNIYWGPERLSGFNRLIYNILTGFRNRARFFGHKSGSRYFWGDLCQKHIKYCRNFSFCGINTLAHCSQMPYHDKKRRYVNHWFASSDGPRIEFFNKLMREENQDRLEREGGCCIVYTHFGCGFYEHGELNSRFVRLMKRLAEKRGWFVPVNELLDYLLKENGEYSIPDRERSKLERRWLIDKIRGSFGRKKY